MEEGSTVSKLLFPTGYVCIVRFQWWSVTSLMTSAIFVGFLFARFIMMQMLLSLLVAYCSPCKVYDVISSPMSEYFLCSFAGTCAPPKKFVYCLVYQKMRACLPCPPKRVLLLSCSLRRLHTPSGTRVTLPGARLLGGWVGSEIFIFICTYMKAWVWWVSMNIWYVFICYKF